MIDQPTSTKLMLLRQAIAASPDNSKLLYKLADALADAGMLGDEFASVFRHAYRLAPEVHPRIPTDVSLQSAARLREVVAALLSHNINYSAQIGTFGLLNAILGDWKVVEPIFDCDQFLKVKSNVKPADDGGGDFYTQLAGELKRDLKFYEGSEERAIEATWRNDRALSSATPACASLAREIGRHVDEYISALSASSHPFVLSRPAEFRISSWAVLSTPHGRHHPHIHPRAWMSGVYYVVQPDIADAEDGRVGWLRIGPPTSHDVGENAAWKSVFIKPAPGTLVLMPGYFYHETAPIRVEQERICIAFDVVPSELWGRKTIG